MGVFIPPGYKLLSDVRRVTDAHALRGQLATGELTAFYIYDGEFREISRSEWIAESGEAMLECGYFTWGRFYHYSNGWGLLDRNASTYPIVVAIPGKAAAMPAAPTRKSKKAKLPLRPVGKPATKMNRIIAKMREMDRTKLSDMKFKEMQHEFGAAPSTCKKARDTVLE